ncbi:MULTISPECIES: rhodanese-like domain-containing protein [unclassified Marinobacterium]|jgi:3-mercaptopyruvate sulfurtransferase SseA|uniref:rhodanese-like domain-containing protein n=1 Tax=unclassified Marinobacterium TaxID=2644139 RepID=UPI00156972A2|nr:MULTISPECIES: rhodanese-like domain-containing protein [unclassified Marinobacterium]NRP15886.1 Rhodanese-like domain protein [Marinobacterium sp. xm-a-152]NRP28625.1 Rhodanese-like domain protein [Marinobacterium sp. xm-d-420]
MKKLLSIATAAVFAGTTFTAIASDENIQLWDKMNAYTVELEDGPMEITRVKTPPALIKGYLQPMVPAEGVTPVGEIDVIEAIGKENNMIVDMRMKDHVLQLGTIPGSINIPYTEVAMNMDQFGCEKEGEGWSCADVTTKIYAFCNSSTCPQSPSGIRAMIREGYPAELIYYYRGGYQDWTIHGLTTVEGEL